MSDEKVGTRASDGDPPAADAAETLSAVRDGGPPSATALSSEPEQASALEARTEAARVAIHKVKGRVRVMRVSS
jgi:hypothetical protein